MAFASTDSGAYASRNLAAMRTGSESTRARRAHEAARREKCGAQPNENPVDTGSVPRHDTCVARFGACPCGHAPNSGRRWAPNMRERCKSVPCPADFMNARSRHMRVVAMRCAYRLIVGCREADAPEVVPPGRAPTGMAFDNGVATAAAPPPPRSAAPRSAGAGALAPREATATVVLPLTKYGAAVLFRQRVTSRPSIHARQQRRRRRANAGGMFRGRRCSISGVAQGRVVATRLKAIHCAGTGNPVCGSDR